MAGPPEDVLEVLATLDYDTPLRLDDPRYVETAEARGSARMPERLAMRFGLLLQDGRFLPPPKKHVLFFGHTGSGKTTELRRYCRRLEGKDHYLVIEASIHEVLDKNNFEYTDLLMALRLSEGAVRGQSGDRPCGGRTHAPTPSASGPAKPD